jgi:hypothetical protein
MTHTAPTRILVERTERRLVELHGRSTVDRWVEECAQSCRPYAYNPMAWPLELLRGVELQAYLEARR